MKKIILTGILISGFISLGMTHVGQSNDINKSPRPSSSKKKKVYFGETYSVIVKSCMPCHNKRTLPNIIKEVKQANFKEIEEETKARIVGALEGLLQRQEEGELLSFDSEKNIQKFYRIAPGAMYTMVNLNVMPPPFAPELMKTIGYNRYVELSMQERIKLLKYANQYSPVMN